MTDIVGRCTLAHVTNPPQWVSDEDWGAATDATYEEVGTTFYGVDWCILAEARRLDDGRIQMRVVDTG